MQRTQLRGHVLRDDEDLLLPPQLQQQLVDGLRHPSIQRAQGRRPVVGREVLVHQHASSVDETMQALPVSVWPFFSFSSSL